MVKDNSKLCLIRDVARVETNLNIAIDEIVPFFQIQFNLSIIGDNFVSRILETNK